MLSDAPSFTTIQSESGVNLNFSDLGSLITNLVPFIFGIVGLLLLIYLVLGGLQLMMSKGDPKAVSGAQSKITNAVIGFIVVLISAGLVVLLGRILGVEVFSNLF